MASRRRLYRDSTEQQVLAGLDPIEAMKDI